MSHLVVTGGASGIGAAVATTALARGFEVTSIDLAPSPVDGVTHLELDITDEAAVTAALDARPAADVVVNNAGIVRFGALLDIDVADWRAVVDVNLTGTFVVARAAARRMVGRGGAIVNITSMNGVAPGPMSGAYGPTKAAISLLTQQMALEWAPSVRVNAVAPGLVDAGMSEAIYADPATRAARESKVPLGRLGTEADIVDVVLWLAGDEARYVTGQTLLVDGGVTMSMIANLPRPASVEGSE